MPPSLVQKSDASFLSIFCRPSAFHRHSIDETILVFHLMNESDCSIHNLTQWTVSAQRR